MVFSTLQFFITIVLAIICAKTFSLSSGDIHVLAMIIPALWILPQAKFSGVVMVAALACYGLTLPHQPVTLSVSVWTLTPLLMVIFSKRSSTGVVVMAALIVTTLQVGIMVTQAGGKLAGSAWITAVQTLSVVMVWWSAYRWRPSNKHSWWALMLIAPLWLAGLSYAALITLCITGIIASMESLSNFALLDGISCSVGRYLRLALPHWLSPQVLKYPILYLLCGCAYSPLLG